MSIAYIGIGSNLGDRLQNCLDAVETMGKRGIFVKSKSSIYETEPWGGIDQPRFLNMVIEAETELSPSEILQMLKGIEQELGRRASYKWGPRSIDLDILLYDNLVVSEEGLKIPHPLMHERDFVLRPLNEIAPDAIHPVLKKSVRELFQKVALRGKRGHGMS